MSRWASSLRLDWLPDVDPSDVYGNRAAHLAHAQTRSARWRTGLLTTCLPQGREGPSTRAAPIRQVTASGRDATDEDSTS